MTEDELDELANEYAFQINIAASDCLDEIERALLDAVDSAINDNFGLHQVMNDAVWNIVMAVLREAVDEDEAIVQDDDAIGELVKAGLDKAEEHIGGVQDLVMKRIANRIFKLVDDFDTEMDRRLSG